MANTLFQRDLSNNYCQQRNENNSWAIPQMTNQNKQKTVQGSYRAKFQPIEIYNQPENTKGVATSLMNLPQYDKLSLTMIRLEDYFLIRAQQIDQDHINLIKRCIQDKKFNPSLFYQGNIQNQRAPIFQQSKKQNFPFIQVDQQQNIFSNSNTFMENNKQNNFFPSVASENQQQQKQQINNIFSNSSSQPQQNNIFQNNSSQNLQCNNIFNQTQNFTQNKVQSDQPINIFQSKENNTNWIQPQQHIINTQIQQNQNQNQNIFANCQQQQLNPISTPILIDNQSQNQLIFNTTQNNLYQNSQTLNQVQDQSILNSQQQNIFQNKQQHQQQQQIPQMQFFQQQQIPASSFNHVQQQLYEQTPFQQVQIQSFINPYDLMEQQINVITNFANALNQSIQTMEQIKKEEEETYIQHEKWVNQIELQRKIDRQKKNIEMNWNPKRNKNQVYSQQQNNLYLKNDINISNKNSRVTCNTVSLSSSQYQFQQTQKRIDKKYLIEVYFEESENFYYFNQQISDNQKKQDTYQQLFNKLDSLQIFKENKNDYFSNSEIIQNENNVQDNQSTLSLRIFQRIRPLLSKKGYQTIPDINQLSLNQLKNVENFTLFNEYGSIQWIGFTNLLYLNLDNLIEISQQKIEVYNQDKIHQLLKPKVGKKLNKACLITLSLPKTVTEENFEYEQAFLQNKCQKQNIDLIKIDLVKQQFQVKVQHFSKYQFNHDENEEDNTEQISKLNDTSCQEQISNEEKLFKIKEQIFEQNYKEIFKQHKDSTNFKIEKINRQFGLKIPQLKDIQAVLLNKEMIQIDLRFCQYYLKSLKQINLDNHNNLISIRLIAALFTMRADSYCKMSPIEKRILAEKLQYFNILFGNALIDIPYTLDLFDIGITGINYDDFLNIKQSNQYQQGLSFMLYLEEIVKQRIQNKDNQQLSSIIINKFKNSDGNINEKQQQIFSYLSKQPKINVGLPIQVDDWISHIIQWESSNDNTTSYSNEWWQSLYSLLEKSDITSPEQASLMYFLLKKFNKPLNRIYDYLNKNHDPVSLFLEILVFSQDKNKNIHKIILTNKLTFYLENKEDSSFLQELLNYFYEQKLFTNKEIERYRYYYCLMEQSLSFQISSLDYEMQLQKLIYTQDYLKVGKFITQNLDQQQKSFVKYLISFAIPINIIFGYQKDLKQIIKSIKQNDQNFAGRDHQILYISQVICSERPFDSQVVDQFIPENIYEYQMMQILNSYYYI